jgi:hypothetical protein
MSHASRKLVSIAGERLHHPNESAEHQSADENPGKADVSPHADTDTLSFRHISDAREPH